MPAEARSQQGRDLTLIGSGQRQPDFAKGPGQVNFICDRELADVALDGRKRAQPSEPAAVLLAFRRILEFLRDNQLGL